MAIAIPPIPREHSAVLRHAIHGLLRVPRFGDGGGVVIVRFFLGLDALLQPEFEQLRDAK